MFNGLAHKKQFESFQFANVFCDLLNGYFDTEKIN